MNLDSRVYAALLSLSVGARPDAARRNHASAAFVIKSFSAQAENTRNISFADRRYVQRHNVRKTKPLVFLPPIAPTR